MSEVKSGKLVGQITLALFFFFLFIYGAWVVGVVFKEPDICFLLGGGRWIVEHGHLPATDPFSYTTVFYNQPYVVEKWLTEVIFYLLWKATSATGLVVFDAVMLVATFVVMPYRLCKLNGLTGAKALAVTWLCALNSFSHLAVRPEIFSYLFIAIFLELICHASQTAAPGKINWKLVGAFFALMILWANLHTLFIMGLMLLALHLCCQVAGRLLFKWDSAFNKTTAVALPLAFLATFINPYGATLWAYLPNVFGSFNNRINEMKPMGMEALHNPFFFPFHILAMIGVVVLIKRGLSRPASATELFFRLLIPGGIAGGIKATRTMPISGLFMASGLARLLAPRPIQALGETRASGEQQATGEQQTTGEQKAFGEHKAFGEQKAAGEQKASEELKTSGLSAFLDDAILPLSGSWMAVCLALGALGAWLMTYIVAPEIPQASAAFKPPFEAIDFIQKARPKGHLLNFPHFGNVMIWRLHDTPAVFIDSRYNLYGDNLLKDYFHMDMCDPGWREMLAKYQIDWVFLLPDSKLAKALSADSDWKVIYHDDAATVIARNQGKKP